MHRKSIKQAKPELKETIVPLQKAETVQEAVLFRRNYENNLQNGKFNLNFKKMKAYFKKSSASRTERSSNKI